MRIYDTHTHIWPDAVAPGAVRTVGGLGGIEANYDGTLDGLLNAMDRAGIDVSFVLPVATKASQVCTINDYSATLVGNPRLVPFGGMHPDFEDPAAEIARMRELGLRGFKMHPEYQAFELDDPRMDAIYAAASEAGAILYFHAGGDVAFDSSRGTPEAFARMLDAWPDLRCVLAHMGGFREWHRVADALAGRDVLIDTSYTLGHLPDEDFVALVRAIGTGRVMFGSDGPWTDASAEIAHMRRLPFTSGELDAMLGGNAEALLAL